MYSFSVVSLLIGFLLLIAVQKSKAQNPISSRSCTSPTLQAQRALGASNTNAQTACTALCASSTTASTTKTFYCTTNSGKCAITNYYYNAPLTSSQSGVLSLVNTGATYYSVPCSLGTTTIAPAGTLAITNAGSSAPYINKEVIFSSPSGNTNPDYITVDPSTGAIVYGPNVATSDLVQTYRITAIQRPKTQSESFSQSVDITFSFASCKIQLSCPTSTVMVDTCSTSESTAFTCTATNVPAGQTLVWDTPSNLASPNPADPNVGAPQSQLATSSAGDKYAPAVVSTTGQAALPAGQEVIFTSEQYVPPNPYSPDYHSNNYAVNPSTSQVLDGTQDADGPGCQTLLVSARVASSLSPYTSGQATVKVCGTNPPVCP